MDAIVDRDLDRGTVRRGLDEAHAALVSAFGDAPDDALGYRPEGDDYALSGLIEHVAGSMRHYAHVLDLLDSRQAAAPGSIPRVGALNDEQDERRVARGYDASERGLALADLAAARTALVSRLDRVPASAFRTGAPVLYEGSDEPYVTSAADVAGWVGDHCREHVAHIRALVTAWRTGTARRS